MMFFQELTQEDRPRGQSVDLGGGVKGLVRCPVERFPGTPVLPIELASSGHLAPGAHLLCSCSNLRWQDLMKHLRHTHFEETACCDTAVLRSDEDPSRLTVVESSREVNWDSSPVEDLSAYPAYARLLAASQLFPLQQLASFAMLLISAAYYSLFSLEQQVQRLPLVSKNDGAAGLWVEPMNRVDLAAA